VNESPCVMLMLFYATYFCWYCTPLGVQLLLSITCLKGSGPCACVLWCAARQKRHRLNVLCSRLGCRTAAAPCLESCEPCPARDATVLCCQCLRALLQICCKAVHFGCVICQIPYNRRDCSAVAQPGRAFTDLLVWGCGLVLHCFAIHACRCLPACSWACGWQQGSKAAEPQKPFDANQAATHTRHGLVWNEYAKQLSSMITACWQKQLPCLLVVLACMHAWRVGGSQQGVLT